MFTRNQVFLCESKKICRSSKSSRVYYFSIKVCTSNLHYQCLQMCLFCSLAIKKKPRRYNLLKHIETRSLYIFPFLLGIAKKNTCAKFQRKMIKPCLVLWSFGSAILETVSFSFEVRRTNIRRRRNQKGKNI